MKVLIVNTSEHAGGAAVAANRLTEALVNHGVKAKMLVRDKSTDDCKVVPLRRSWLTSWHFLWERLVIFFHLRGRRQHLFDIDIANSSVDITRLREFQEADVIHLHWINQGMLSIANIQKIIQSGKPVVWTMHDMWPATAICHLTLGCRRFTTQCCQCRLLPDGGSAHDLAYKVWRRKRRMLEQGDVVFVACSRWLEGEAKSSALLDGHLVMNIPNPIDTGLFRKTDKQEARKRLGIAAEDRVVLFVSQRVTNEYKGMKYLLQACDMLKDIPHLAVAVLGGQADDVIGQIPVKGYSLGYVSSESRMVDVYNAADVFVLPSLSENLPNTIMEAMACGVPSVGFRVGGIPEEIDHLRNGYVAQYRQADDLAKGIRWVLTEADYDALSREAIHKVARCYSQSSVSLRYAEVYQQALTNRNYHL